jgi:ribosomal protein S1
MTKTCLFLSLILPLRVFSQDAEIFKPDSIKKEVIATKINSSLRIDGILNEGDVIKVKLIGTDPKSGKFKLSRKALIAKPERQDRPAENN